MVWAQNEHLRAMWEKVQEEEEEEGDAERIDSIISNIRIRFGIQSFQMNIERYFRTYMHVRIQPVYNRNTRQMCPFSEKASDLDFTNSVCEWASGETEGEREEAAIKRKTGINKCTYVLYRYKCGAIHGHSQVSAASLLRKSQSTEIATIRWKT